MRFKFLVYLSCITAIVISGCVSSGHIQAPENNNSYNGINLDTVKAGKFDMGKMWTFEYPPSQYFNEEYNFTPSQAWFDKVRMSALRFATYCSASFISEDGLIMTNNHCARESAVGAGKEGENLANNGFYAETLADERPVEGLFVDQLVLIKDVTDEVLSAVDKAPAEDKSKVEQDVINAIEKRETDSTGLEVSVTALYNGGKYSLYGYKRYKDVRLVFTPEHLLGYFGGDYDNFTYPRYDLDFAFFRVYDEGKPLKTENYFKWSKEGANPGEPVFVVGNPGSTSRLLSVSQLKYLRDVQYPQTLNLYNSLIKTYNRMIKDNPDSAEELNVKLLSLMNGQKVYEGMIRGLNDPVLMQRKVDFEKTFREKVASDPGLNSRYGKVWQDIEENENALRELNRVTEAFNPEPDSVPLYFYIAGDVVELANAMYQDSAAYTGEMLDSSITAIIPEDYDTTLNNRLLANWLDKLTSEFGTDDPFVYSVTGGRTGSAAVQYLLNKSVIDDPGKLTALIKQGPDAVANSKDAFIEFVINAGSKASQADEKTENISKQEELNTQQLGRALFEVYGTSIPPDATFTLRISDGVVAGYPYNGTIAPPITTFYGLYDRYYSFRKEYPWDLPEKWQNPPAEFDLSCPFNFVSTNDITGGNSGSPVINRNAEIVGVAFDGNIESLPGNFIFRTEENRTVSVHSRGITEALSDIYKAKRLVDEVTAGRIVRDETAVSK